MSETRESRRGIVNPGNPKQWRTPEQIASRKAAKKRASERRHAESAAFLATVKASDFPQLARSRREDD